MKYGFFILFLSLLAACGTSSTTSTVTNAFADCQYGPPKAIFSDKIPLVSAHSFELGAKTAVETVVFDRDIRLELTQSGCEKPKQVFQFTIPGDSTGYSPEEWVEMALNQFKFLGSLHEPLQALHFWGNALSEQKETIKLGQPVPLEQGRFVKIDKVADSQKGILMIELYQE